MTTSTLILFSCCFGVSLGLNSWDLPQTNLLSFVNAALDQDWMLFKTTYNKTYADTNEEIRRRLYWEDTLQFIREHNRKFDRGYSTFTVGENDFADMAEDEFEDIYLRGLILPEEEEEYPEALTEPDPEAPSRLDWRKRGFVSSVKNQGKCGSCWAFSAIGALEGQQKKHHGGPVGDLSEQNLVDCANEKWGNHGCAGRFMNYAFKYIRDNRGVDSEICYPYIAKNESCQYLSCCRAAMDRGWQNVGRSGCSLQSALAKVGPVSIGMDTNHRSFWFYKSGIYYEPACVGKYPNHAMVAVGYGVRRGAHYWIIKNSWGTKWGYKGYVFVARDKDDKCGITLYASYPTGV